MFSGCVYRGYFGGAGSHPGRGARPGVGELQLANALKTVLSLVTATVAAIVIGLFGPVSWPYLAVCAPASLAGRVAGVKIATRLSATPLRIFIITFGVAVAVFLFLRA